MSNAQLTAPIHLQTGNTPFTDLNTDQWHPAHLGPAWITPRPDGGWTSDIHLCTGMARFLNAVTALLAGEQWECMTTYAVHLTGQAVTAGDLHYDTGTRNPDYNVTRCVATWTSDDYKIQNVFLRQPDQATEDMLIDGPTPDVDSALFIQPPNRHVVRFDEGTTLHGRRHTPARPGQHGYFMSAAIYRPQQTVNLHCPRLAELTRRPQPAGISQRAENTRHVW